MKRLTLILASVLILVITSSAQSGSFIVADVPFSFHVQNSHASPGTYRISYQGSCKEYLAITDSKGTGMIAGLTFPSLHTGKSSPKLVFHRYGEEYFLVAIHMPNLESWNVPVSERALVSHRIVLTKAQPEEVIVMARLDK